MQIRKLHEVKSKMCNNRQNFRKIVQVHECLQQRGKHLCVCANLLLRFHIAKSRWDHVVQERVIISLCDATWSVAEQTD